MAKFVGCCYDTPTGYGICIISNNWYTADSFFKSQYENVRRFSDWETFERIFGKKWVKSEYPKGITQTLIDKNGMFMTRLKKRKVYG